MITNDLYFSDDVSGEVLHFFHCQRLSCVSSVAIISSHSVCWELIMDSGLSKTLHVDSVSILGCVYSCLDNVNLMC